VTTSKNFFFLEITVLAAAVGMVNSCYTYEIVNLFRDEMRYSGMGVAYNFGFAIFGGVAPLVVTFFLKVTHNPLILYYFFLFSALLTFSAMLIKGRKTQEIVTLQTKVGI
jgi:hypothetical protein